MFGKNDFRKIGTPRLERVEEFFKIIVFIQDMFNLIFKYYEFDKKTISIRD